MHSNIGQRLAACAKRRRRRSDVPRQLSDGLSDLPLDGYVPRSSNTTRSPVYSPCGRAEFSRGKNRPDEMVTALEPVSASDPGSNGRLHVAARGCLRLHETGEKLVEQPFGRLIAERKLWAPRHRGFWAAMDTFRTRSTRRNGSTRECRGWCGSASRVAPGSLQQVSQPMSAALQTQHSRGAAWMVLFKMAERSLGLISTLILVRVLSRPTSARAMAISFIAMAELLSAFGFDIALIQNQQALGSTITPPGPAT